MYVRLAFMTNGILAASVCRCSTHRNGIHDFVMKATAASVHIVNGIHDYVMKARSKRYANINSTLKLIRNLRIINF